MNYGMSVVKRRRPLAPSMAYFVAGEGGDSEEPAGQEFRQSAWFVQGSNSHSQRLLYDQIAFGDDDATEGTVWKNWFGFT